MLTSTLNIKKLKLYSRYSYILSIPLIQGPRRSDRPQSKGFWMFNYDILPFAMHASSSLVGLKKWTEESSDSLCLILREFYRKYCYFLKFQKTKSSCWRRPLSCWMWTAAGRWMLAVSMLTVDQTPLPPLSLKINGLLNCFTNKILCEECREKCMQSSFLLKLSNSFTRQFNQS